MSTNSLPVVFICMSKIITFLLACMSKLTERNLPIFYFEIFWLDTCCAILFLFHLVIFPVLSGYCMASCCFMLQSTHATTQFQHPRSYLCFQIRSTITQSPNTIILESDRNEKEISKEQLVAAPLWTNICYIFTVFSYLVNDLDMMHQISWQGTTISILSF